MYIQLTLQPDICICSGCKCKNAAYLFSLHTIAPDELISEHYAVLFCVVHHSQSLDWPLRLLFQILQLQMNDYKYHYLFTTFVSNVHNVPSTAVPSHRQSGRPSPAHRSSEPGLAVAGGPLTAGGPDMRPIWLASFSQSTASGDYQRHAAPSPTHTPLHQGTVRDRRRQG